MQDYDVMRIKEYIGLLLAYSIATSTETDPDKHSITGHVFVEDPANDSYCLGAAFTLGLPV